MWLRAVGFITVGWGAWVCSAFAASVAPPQLPMLSTPLAEVESLEPVSCTDCIAPSTVASRLLSIGGPGLQGRFGRSSQLSATTDVAKHPPFRVAPLDLDLPMGSFIVSGPPMVESVVQEEKSKAELLFNLVRATVPNTANKTLLRVWP